jgi:hypothetical protein
MSAWTSDIAAALPDNDNAAVQTDAPAEAAAPDTRAQDHGWAPKSAYDYETYLKSATDLADAQAVFTVDEPQYAVGGLAQGIPHSQVRLNFQPIPFTH